MRTIIFATCVGTASLAGLAGCRSTAKGHSSFEIVHPPAGFGLQSRSKPETSASRIEFVEPLALGALTLPVYPASALAARAGERIVYLTFTIDESGNVRDAHPTIDRLHLPDRFAEEFLSATISAVEQWKFRPGHRVYWEKDAAGEDRYVRAEKIERTIDVKFTFETSGKVR